MAGRRQLLETGLYREHGADELWISVGGLSIHRIFGGLMNSDQPQRPNLVKATTISLLVALFLLVTVVLPAEYGLDPLGTIASGALLATVPAEQAEHAIMACTRAGIACYRIGTVTAEPAERLLHSASGTASKN